MIVHCRRHDNGLLPDQFPERSLSGGRDPAICAAWVSNFLVFFLVVLSQNGANVVKISPKNGNKHNSRVMCGLAGALFILVHRKIAMFMRTNRLFLAVFGKR